MSDSAPLCKTGGLDLTEYLSRFLQNGDVFPNVVEHNSERFSRSVELSEILFRNSPHAHMQITPADEHQRHSHGAVVNSLDGGLAGFVVDEPQDMETLLRFLENVSGFFVASIVDPKDLSKVSLMLDWTVSDVRE